MIHIHVNLSVEPGRDGHYVVERWSNQPGLALHGPFATRGEALLAEGERAQELLEYARQTYAAAQDV